MNHGLLPACLGGFFSYPPNFVVCQKRVKPNWIDPSSRFRLIIWIGWMFVSLTLIGSLYLYSHNLTQWLVVCLLDSDWLFMLYIFSMRTIPFTVPSTGSRPRPGDQRLVEEGSTSVTSGSEPSTPSTAPTTRGSMDSLSSAAGDNSFRGMSRFQ